MKTKLKFSLILGFVAMQTVYAADKYHVVLKDATFKVVDAGPNLSGNDGCKINNFGSKVEKDLKADPLLTKISLNYNALNAQINRNSYKFYLTNKNNKKLYSANQYTEGLLLAPYRFIEVTGKNSESSEEIMINGHKYRISDIWFSSVCLTQEDCQNYVNTSVGFINPEGKNSSVCYVYNNPYVPKNGKISNVIKESAVKTRKKELSEECSKSDINGDCVNSK